MKLKYILIFLVLWSVGIVVLMQFYFPGKEANTLIKKIPPTQHELEKLAKQIADPEIAKAKIYFVFFCFKNKKIKEMLEIINDQRKGKRKVRGKFFELKAKLFCAPIKLN